MINPFVYFLLFLKATLFSSGGFSNLPSLRQDLVASSWAHEADFGQAVAIGQLSPGPNGLWAIALGYLTFGYLGALLALIAITVPPLLVLFIAAMYHRIEHQRWVPNLMRGISLAVIAIQLTVSWALISRNGSDWRSWLIFAGTCGLALNKHINILLILGAAGLVGYLLYR